MPDFAISDGFQVSDGPDHLRGSHACTAQHDGTEREGHPDWCCCCDPCRYIRPSRTTIQRHCCRCTPKMICLTFTPDDTADACCQSISLPLLAQFDSTPFWTVYYEGSIGGITYRLAIAKEETDGPCYWRLTAPALYVDEHIEIDHVNVSCLSVPDISIDDVTDANGCTGTITFANYEAAKIPFRHQIPDSPDIEMRTPTWATSDPPGTPQCTCTEVPRFLCVDGIRHADGSREQVQFDWDDTNGDRWSFLPCNGDPSLDQEHIYLRGDQYGNCYLEFDFEQTGGDTNDWADPPNTLGTDIHEIRPGMVAVESCGCDIHAYSETSIPDDPQLSQRFVYINAGDCGCWKYLCGTCRCVPQRLCVFGEIDGEYITGEALWDGTAWQFAADGTMPAFTINIGPDECDNCVLTVDGTFTVPFLPSTPVECGEFLSGEVESEYDETTPGTFNWLWMSAAACPCNVGSCVICAETRCGGPPAIVYFDLEARTNFIPLPPGWVYQYCNITIPLTFYQRWLTTPPQRVQCGYVGYKVVHCPAYMGDPEQNFVIRVSIGDDGFGQPIWRMDRADLTDRGPGGYASFANVFPEHIWPPIGSSPATCDPFLFVLDWDNSTRNCQWGCERLPVEIKLTFTE